MKTIKNIKDILGNLKMTQNKNKLKVLNTSKVTSKYL